MYYQIGKRALEALGGVMIDTIPIKKRKGVNCKPTVMLSRLPLWLTGTVVKVIFGKHTMLGVGTYCGLLA